MVKVYGYYKKNNNKYYYTNVAKQKNGAKIHLKGKRV